MNSNPGGGAALGRAREHHGAGRIQEADALYRQALREAPSPEAHDGLGVLCAQMGKGEEAAAQFAAAAAQAPDNPLYHVHHAQALMSLGRSGEAVTVLRRALVLRPEHAEAHFNLGNVLRETGDLVGAIASYRRAAELAPKVVPVRINLGVTLQATGAYDEAIAELEKAAEMAPGSHEANYNLGIVLALQRRFAEAEAAYRRALNANPDAPAVHVNLGSMLHQQGRTVEAIASYQRAVALAPDLAQAHANLAAAFSDMGNTEAARRAIERAVTLEPHTVQWRVSLAQTLRDMGDGEAAEAQFRRALAIEPGHVGALGQFSLVLQQRRKLDEARALLDYPRLLRTRRLDRAEGWPDPSAFNAELARYVHGHPTLQHDPPGRATKIGSQTLEIVSDDAPVIAALRGFFEGAVRGYLADVLAKTESPLRAPPPPRWGLHGWAVVLRAQGHQTPHFHPAGIASGVYYVQVPRIVGSAGEAGYIRFGHPLDAPEADGLSAAIRPEPGLLVLFPSDFWHYTVPFGGDEERISIAFDVLPVK